MKPLEEYDEKGILSDEVFVEIFEQEDLIEKTKMIVACQDRAKTLKVKQQFDSLLKAYSTVNKEISKRNSGTLLENMTT